MSGASVARIDSSDLAVPTKLGHDGRMTDQDGDFYEDDEPVEKILAIMDREPDGVTEPPNWHAIFVTDDAFESVRISGVSLSGFAVSYTPSVDISR